MNITEAFITPYGEGEEEKGKKRTKDRQIDSEEEKGKKRTKDRQIDPEEESEKGKSQKKKKIEFF